MEAISHKERICRKLQFVIVTVTIIAVLIGAFYFGFHVGINYVRINGNAGLGVDVTSNLGKPVVHVTVTFWQYGRKIAVSEHPGAVTNFGLNTTFAKWTGNSTFYNMTTYNLNTTYIGIGYMSSGPNSTSTILDGEWNRTLATQHTLLYNGFNVTAIIYPDAGPYSANTIGGYLEEAGNSLMFYDTISPTVSGITSSFVITIEFKVSAS